METVVHKGGFLLARMKAVPSGQTSVKQGQKLMRSKGKRSGLKIVIYRWQRANALTRPISAILAINSHV